MLAIVATDFIAPTHIDILVTKCDKTVTKCESTVQCNACCCLNLMRRLSLIGIDAIWQLSLGFFVDEDNSKLPTLYWLPKLHKRPYKSRFIANSSACTTTELSIRFTSCFTAIKTMSFNIAQQFMKEMVKIYFGVLKIQVKFLIN